MNCIDLNISACHISISFALATFLLRKTVSVFFANSDGLNPTVDIIYYYQYDA